MILALVSLREAADLMGVVGLTLFGAFLWSRMRRKDQLRRAAQKERQAEYARRHHCWDCERDEAQRYFGTGVR